MDKNTRKKLQTIGAVAGAVAIASCSPNRTQSPSTFDAKNIKSEEYRSVDDYNNVNSIIADSVSYSVGDIVRLKLDYAKPNEINGGAISEIYVPKDSFNSKIIIVFKDMQGGIYDAEHTKLEKANPFEKNYIDNINSKKSTIDLIK